MFVFGRYNLDKRKNRIANGVGAAVVSVTDSLVGPIAKFATALRSETEMNVA